MSYTIIDKKSESHKYGWGLEEDVTTTMSLMNIGNEKIGLSYEANYSGIKSGGVHGGPFEVTGDETKIVHDSPKVEVIISNFNKKSSYVSLHVKITVDIPVIGTETIYDQTLGGEYSESTGWAAVGPAVASLMEKRKSAFTS